MATETASTAGGRPNPILLAALAVAVIAFAYMKFSGPAVPTSVQTPAGRTRAAANGEQVKPADLDVRVEDLKRPAPAIGEGRNIFRFPPPPAPPMPPEQSRPNVPVAPTPMVNLEPPKPVGPPPISNFIKFIGIAETASGKIGAFSTWDPQTRECKATFPGREGEVVEGRYRVVRIGIESAQLEYLDGTGRTTLPLNGQACVSK